MERFIITFRVYRQSDTGYLLRIAGKIIEDLFASGMSGKIVAAQPPWQLALEGCGNADYIFRQVLDGCDRRLCDVQVLPLS